MLSDKAISKSVNNGFSELEHIESGQGYTGVIYKSKVYRNTQRFKTQRPCN